MRIDRLDLNRYGHFSDFTLDFGRTGDSNIDLHIIYGANEAGKSTMLAALCDTLFGIQRQSNYGFLHTYDLMEIGACLNQNSELSELRRFKNKLTDSHGIRLDESVIDTHGIGRENYLARFSFDDKTLEKGGDSILQNQGEIGAALFSATSGLSDITDRLKMAMQASDQFYDYGKEKDKDLPLLKKKLIELEQTRKTIDIQSGAWRKLKITAHDKQQLYRTTQQALEKQTAELAQLRKQSQALGVAEKINQIGNQLEELGELPSAPTNWLTLVRKLSTFEIEHSALLSATRLRQQQLTDRQATLAPDEKLLAVGTRLDAFSQSQSLRTAKKTQMHDLQNERSVCKQTIQSIRRRLPVAASIDNSQIILPVATLSLLEVLNQEYSNLQTRLTLAETECCTLNQQQLIQSAAIESSTEPVDHSAVENLVKLIQERAPHQALAQIEKQLHAKELLLNDELARLKPWKGTSDTLRQLAIPTPQRIATIGEKLTELEQQIQLNSLKLQESLQHSAKVRHSLKAATTHRHIDDQSAANLREQRNSAWQLHTEAVAAASDFSILLRTFHEFGRLLDADDALTEQRLNNSDHLATLRQLEESEKQLSFAQVQLTTQGSRLAAELKTVHTDVTQCAVSIGLPENTGINDIRHWLQRHEIALKSANELQLLHQEKYNLTATNDQFKERLSAQLPPLFAPSSKQQVAGAGLEELLGLALSALQIAQNSALNWQQQRANSVRLQTDLNLRTAEVHKQKQLMLEWQNRWELMVAETWIKNTEINTVSAMLGDLKELQVADENDQHLQLQIEHLQSDQTQFTIDANELFTCLNLAAVEDPDSQLDNLAAQLSTTRQIVAKHQQVKEDLQQIDQDLEQQNAVLQPVLLQLATMQRQCAAESSHELIATLESIKKHNELKQQLLSLEQELKDALEVDSTAAAMAELDDKDRQSLEVRINSLEIEAQQEQQHVTELHHEFRTAQLSMDQLAGDSEAAALSEQHANIIHEIEHRAIDTLRSRLGREVINAGLRRYRDQSKSTLMRRAKDAFVTVTCGNFTDLRTQPDAKGFDKLVGINRAGRSLSTHSMSTGTRFQLYLSLRVAAYHEYCIHKEPLPFVADDIMETFDDHRSAAAFQLLRDMAKRGQVIYLTHHQHLLGIAKQVIGPSVQIHQLP